jgi:hypothetical protein
MFCIDAAPDTLGHKSLSNLRYKLRNRNPTSQILLTRERIMSTKSCRGAAVPSEAGRSGVTPSEGRTAVGPGHVKYRRLFAILAFVAGGFSAELSAPLQCTLIHASRPYQKRRKV